MDTLSPYLITDLPGYTPQISRLLVMLRYARDTTLHAVAGMSTAELDHLHDESSNSIGMLLAHIASNELYFRILTMDRRELTPEEWEKWRPALDLGDRGREAIKGNALSYYTDMLEEIRTTTLRVFAETPDTWLDDVHTNIMSHPTNNYFAWFHVIEDEVNHRGQIRWFRKRLPRPPLLYSREGGG